MVGQISNIAATLLIKAWYRDMGFDECELLELTSEQIIAMEKGEQFELDGDINIVIASDGKFYMRGE